MRKEMLQKMYDEFINGGLCPKATEQFEEILEYVKSVTNSEECSEEVGNMIAGFEHAVFMSACHMLLDFISGKEKESAA